MLFVLIVRGVDSPDYLHAPVGVHAG